MRFCGHCGAAAAPAGATEAVPSTTQSVTPAGVAEPEPDALRAFVTGQVADRLIESGGQLTEERRLVTALFADLRCPYPQDALDGRVRRASLVGSPVGIDQQCPGIRGNLRQRA